MSRLATVIAAAAGGSAAQAESRAVGLDMSKSLAVVALLRLSRARKGAAVGLVACQGRVVRVRDGGGVGIRFEDAYLAACLFFNLLAECS